MKQQKGRETEQRTANVQLLRTDLFWYYLFPSGIKIWHLNVKPINQINHAAPIRCPARGRTGFSELRGLQASVPFFPRPLPTSSTFFALASLLSATELLSPHTNAEKFLHAVQICSGRMGTLATQASARLNHVTGAALGLSFTSDHAIMWLTRNHVTGAALGLSFTSDHAIMWLHFV